MPKKPEAQSYEIAEYSPPVLDVNTAYKAIRQIFVEMKGNGNSAQAAVWADMSGDKLKIHYHSYEMHLPTRLRDVTQQSNEILNETIKLLKKEFKVKTGATLKLAEDKNLGNYTVEKVSLNERYYYKAWRFFTVSF
jgi:hypothetical protein